MTKDELLLFTNCISTPPDHLNSTQFMLPSSNASDALDKLRFLSVMDPSVLVDGGDLVIRIKPDSEAGTVTIT